MSGRSLFPAALMLAGVLWFSAGCGKKAKPIAETPAPTPEAVKQVENDHPPVYAPTTAVPTPAAAPNTAPDLGELNRGMLRWILRNKRKPASFDEFSATAGIAIPPPPPGKKYIIAPNLHIQLVDR